ncbi:MepB family protein [Staphylococcus lutrae]|uniref:Uncharacterized protein n=1 Tax=Staphylococcus lutrae TaxID=155085 RepID=A0AAC9RUU9_9STAP|nr:hypothetical protein B5P37_08150 [Staphylococcus lutrae]PNZ39529.1 hypothetical protein CD134_01480 [Staphylococcus lutrae]
MRILEGQFVFPFGVLTEKGIIQSVKSKGNIAFRVYLPWVKAFNVFEIIYVI